MESSLLETHLLSALKYTKDLLNINGIIFRQIILFKNSYNLLCNTNSYVSFVLKCHSLAVIMLETLKS